MKISSTSRELSAELKTVAEGGGGIPGLIKLLGRFTAAFKTGSSQKREWRREIRNDFTALAAAFNTLIRQAEKVLAGGSRAERVLFLVDGTDKMRGEDTQQFFVQDAEQLLAIASLVIYTAPLDLKVDGRLGGKLDADIVLPMIKLQERDGTPCEVGRKTMRQLLQLRADPCLFASEAEVDRLVAFSGGHPREVLRLLAMAIELAGAMGRAVRLPLPLSQVSAQHVARDAQLRRNPPTAPAPLQQLAHHLHLLRRLYHAPQLFQAPWCTSAARLVDAKADASRRWHLRRRCPDQWGRHARR